jgi:hypothetical protein
LVRRLLSTIVREVIEFIKGKRKALQKAMVAPSGYVCWKHEVEKAKRKGKGSQQAMRERERERERDLFQGLLNCR